jgi:AraC family transcriptional activator of pobA
MTSVYHDSAGITVIYQKQFRQSDKVFSIASGHAYIILLVCSGSIHIVLNQAAKVLTAGQLIVFSSVPDISVSTISDESLVSMVAFTGKFAMDNSIIDPPPGFFNFFYVASPPVVTLHKKDIAALLSHIKTLESKIREPQDRIFKKEVLLFSFSIVLYELAALYYSYSYRITLRRSGKEKLTLKFLQIVENHFRSQHSVTFYADALFVTPGHLNKTVRLLTGKTAKEHIEDKLILRAKILLHNTSLKLLAIADELHFAGSSSFSNFFKKHTKLSPSAYRQGANL